MYELFFKRFFDLLFSISALLALSPLILVIYILVKTDSPGPFLFKQIRIGKNLKRYTIYKIRTMNEEAGIDANNEKLKYVTTSQNDIRITKIGLKLRKYHFDEIPQFLNVLRADMSIVGVRPDAPSQEADYKQHIWVERHNAKPGITGLAQIKSSKNYFNNLSRQRYDLFYVKSTNKFKLDFYIYMQTILKILRGSSF